MTIYNLPDRILPKALGHIVRHSEVVSSGDGFVAGFETLLSVYRCGYIQLRPMNILDVLR